MGEQNVSPQKDVFGIWIILGRLSLKRKNRHRKSSENQVEGPLYEETFTCLKRKFSFVRITFLLYRHTLKILPV